MLATRAMRSWSSCADQPRGRVGSKACAKAVRVRPRGTSDGSLCSGVAKSALGLLFSLFSLSPSHLSSLLLPSLIFLLLPPLSSSTCLVLSARRRGRLAVPSMGGLRGIWSGAPKSIVEGSVSLGSVAVMVWRAREAERTGLMQRRFDAGTARAVEEEGWLKVNVGGERSIVTACERVVLVCAVDVAGRWRSC